MVETVVAQVGIGYWGPNILRNLVNSDQCSVKKVVEIDKPRQLWVKENYPDIEVVSDIKSALNDDSINAILISTPVRFHYDQAIKVLSAGKHVFVEKPMARSVEEVRSIGNLAKSRGLRAMVGHTYLFSPAVRFIKQYLDSGQLGDILSIYSQRLNLGKVRSDVDALWNLAPHDIAMIQYWLDNKKPTEINRVGQSFLQADIDDVVYLTMKYSSGTIASIQVSWMDPTKTRKTVLVGSKGMIVFDDTAEDKIQVLNKSISINSGHTVAGQAESGHFSNPEFTYSDDGVQIPKLVDTEPLAAELGHFFDCIEDNSLECLCDYRHAESVVRILSGNLDD